MLTRTHKILIGLLAAQLGLAAVTLTRSDDAAARAEAPLLAGFDAAAVTRLRVEGEGGERPLDIVKRGDAWVLASHFDHPVLASKVTDLLAPLAKLGSAAPIATQASRHAQLGVADTDHQRKLTITAGGKDTTLFVGGPAGGRRTAVRLAGGDDVHAVTGLSAWAISTQPRGWIDTAHVRVPRDEIVRLTVERRAGGKLELARAKAGDPWTVTLDGVAVSPGDKETLATAKLDEIVGAAASIDIQKPSEPRRAVIDPVATITIERATSAASVAPTVIDVLADPDGYWVHDRASASAGIADKAALSPLIDTTRAQLVTPAP